MKFRRKGVIALTAALCVALFASAAMAVDVSSPEGLQSALADGGNINITASFSSGSLFQVTKDTNITLNGNTITRAGTSTGATPVFYVTNGKLTLSNGSIVSTNSAGGTAEGVRVQTSNIEANASVELNDIDIQSESIALSIYGDVSGGASADSKPTYNVSATINGNSTLYGPSVGVFLIGKQATLTLNSGEIKSDDFGISGNGTRNADENCGGTVIAINGGTVISEQTCAIYQPQAGTITITGGTITGYDGIQMKSGTLNMTGGTLEGTGAFDDDYTYEEGQHDGSIATGAALAILSEGVVADTGYAGDITVNISGSATLKSTEGYAIAEAFSNSSSESKFTSLTISGGTFIGANDKNAMAMTNVKTDENGNSNTNITGGMFSSDPRECKGMENATIAEGTMDENGNYVISSPEPEPSTPQHSGGGGGCSAGFGALALLAVVPLLRMRKK